MTPTPDPLLVSAIEQKRRLSFTYNGKPRLAEPQCYGVGNSGKQLLHVHLLEGGSQPEPLFDVARIEALVVIEDTFIRPGPHYTKNDSAMKTIFAQL